MEKRIATETHDLGFPYTLSCVAAWRLTGDAEARRVAVLAADLLLERFFAAAGIIQAWGDLTDMEQRGRMIIDCCMNLPLLYWASEVTGNPRYASAAQPKSNGVLLHAVYNKPAKVGVDECTIWGDYYYMEALIRLTTDWKVFW